MRRLSAQAQDKLYQNSQIKGPTEVIQIFNKYKKDPNKEIAEEKHNEAIASNKYIYKPGTEEILHKDALKKALQNDQEITPDTAIKEKLKLKKEGIYREVLRESMSVTGGSPIAPIASTPLNVKITSAYFNHKNKKNKKNKRNKGSLWL